MANVIRLVPKVRREEDTAFSGHSGDVYVLKMESEDKAFTTWLIYADSPTPGNFNDAPVGSILINTANGAMYVKTGATTWGTVSVT